MESLQAVLAEQEAVMHSIRQTITNLKKLGKEKITEAVLRRRIASLEENFKTCRSRHAVLVAQCDSKTKAAHPYFTEDQFATSEDVYNEAADFMAELLAQRAATPGASNEASTRKSDRLPRLRLPQFDGSFDQWEAFRDKFKSMVLTDQTLAQVDCMHHLSSCVTGEAAKAINHLAITEGNFRIAWKLLESRYENKRRLITHHLRNLTELPTVTHENAEKLRDLRDRMNHAIQALINLERPVDKWDDMLVYIIAQRLDPHTRKAWELELGDTVDYPPFSRLSAFLDSRIRALESMPDPPNKDNKGQVNHAWKPERHKSVSSHSATLSSSCPVCRAGHLIVKCDAFRNKSPSERIEIIRNSNRCFNCFSAKHAVKDCASKHACKQCSERHHTLLHLTPTAVTPTEPKFQTPAVSTDRYGLESVHTHLTARASALKAHVMLATARVRVYSPSGHHIEARALLDQGSATSIVTERLVQTLRLPKMRRAVRITGVGDNTTTVRHAVELTISPAFAPTPAFTTTALVLRALTRYAPHRGPGSDLWPHVADLRLADTAPMSSDPIDVLIGADLYGSLLLDGVRKGGRLQPIAQRSVLGWFLSGTASFGCSSDQVVTHHSIVNASTDVIVDDTNAMEELNRTLRSFWEVEAIPDTNSLDAEEKRAEEHFATTHTRTQTGRYVVRLPFKNGPPKLGASRPAAISRLLHVERKLALAPEQGDAYHAFMDEYIRLGHMEQVKPTEPPNAERHYYIPHHAVIKGDSGTTPLRVVFNASCRASAGQSLNDHLCVGPKLQTDLPAILTRWRQYRYVYTADSAKMYRQIMVDPRDRDYQLILWRVHQNAPVSEYRLRTVTYGTASASYQAQRVLRQLAEDEGAAYPLATPVLRNQTYVDDCIFGADELEVAIRTREQLSGLLKKGGFHLRKWASNQPALLAGIDSADHGLAREKEFKGVDHLKVLGVYWSPSEDALTFRVSALEETHVEPSKRTVMSTIARLYDPLGFISPATITAKMLLQRLWLTKCEWDDPLPPDLRREWEKYFASLSALQAVAIPRWTNQRGDTTQYSLHGFADASNSAYAAVVYSRIVSSDGSVSISLIAAKSKVAPLKTMSIPRLELSAALLMTRLMQSTRALLAPREIDCHCWTDSTVALAWIAESPSRWQTFVANRVAKIQDLLPDASWRHVPTLENPADCASRGLNGHELVLKELWWGGPAWLRLHGSRWPAQPPILAKSISLEKRADRTVCLASVDSVAQCPIASRFSSWPKLLRVTAYLNRFISNSHLRASAQTTRPKPKHSSVSDMALRPHEIERAKNHWIRRIQNDSFPSELESLSKGKPVAPSSPVSSLNPFIDSEGIMRVGGRLRRSNLPEKAIHPVLVRSHPILAMLITHHHLRTLHGGHSLTLSSLRDEYWILRARTTVRQVLHRCVACARERATVPRELMGDLPATRTNRTLRAFVHTGVDYAGPILVRNAAGRGHKSHKAYIALFVCMTTKAIHLELVHDYGSVAFLAAFHRFVSRRGTPSSMYSDNGTTFQGAERELIAAHRVATNDPALLNAIATERISWNFIPPSAPHFGGLWEAGVKAAKRHLRRCVGRHTLTAEEMTTILCRIEACLNSRPIAPISENLEDYSALTPGHFLIGAPLIAAPEPSVLHLREQRLSRWQLVHRLTELVWRAWRNDYLHTLQQRPKWRTVQRLAEVGRLVILRHDAMPPSHWEMGRIIACHPGADGLTRVVTVRTARSVYRRPITKICFLPVEINQEGEAERNSEPDTAGGDETAATPKT